MIQSLPDMYGILPLTKGGTGFSTYAAGDLIYASAINTLSKLTAGSNGDVLTIVAGLPAWQAPTSSGTVTSFSAGNLSPLFTTSVATATTTPALSFSLTNATGGTWFGNNAGIAGAPSYNSAGALTKVDDTNVTLTLGGTPTTALLNATSLTLGWSGTLSSGRGGTGFSTYAAGDLIYASAINTLSKLTAGSNGKILTLVAGLPSWENPATSGTVTSFSAGNLSPLFTTSVATATTTPALSFSLTNATGGTWFGNNTGIAGAPSYNSAGALTKVDDTNITLTLGGTPTTALLNATSLTLGWSGTLSPTRGGTGISNNAASTLTISGAFASTFSVSGTFTYTFPTATSTLLANNLGLSGGTTLVGGTAASENIILSSTSNATKGFIYFGGLLTSYWDENLDRLVLSTTTATPMSIASSFTGLSSITYSQSVSGTTSQVQFRVQNSSSNRMSLGMTSAGFTTGSGIVADMGFIDASGAGGLGIRSSGGGDIVNIITGTVYSRLTTTGLTLASGVLGLGTTAVANSPITSSFSVAGNAYSKFTNSNAGTTATSGIQLLNNAANGLTFQTFGGGFTTAGLLIANMGELRMTGAGGMLISSTTASTNIIFAIGGTGTANEILRFTSSSVSLIDSINFALGTTTGTKFGTSSLQKMGWWNATPVVQQTGYTNTNVVTTRSFNANTVSLRSLADIVGTLINDLKTYGLLGA